MQSYHRFNPAIAPVIVVALILVLIAPEASAQEPPGADVATAAVGNTQVALDTSIPYQGQLTDGGNPANGAYDFQFKLFDDASAGSQIGGEVNQADVAVANGLFSVALDFGGVFNGEARYLEIGVRPGASTGAYTTLSPRRSLLASPYALYSNATRGLSVDGNGYVGIGTTNPVANLTVQGSTDPASEVGTLTLNSSATATKRFAAGFSDTFNAGYIQSINSGSAFLPTLINPLSGNVGIGTISPAKALHVFAQGTSGVARFESTRTVAQIDLLTSEGPDNSWSLVNASGGRFAVYTPGAGDVLNILNNGNIGVNTQNPARRLHVYAQGTNGSALFESNQTSAQVDLLSSGGPDNMASILGHSDGRFTIDTVPTGAEFTILRNGNVGIGVAIPQAKLDIAGTMRADIVQITGGDLAEPFEIADADTIQPGMVVAIDPDNPGQMRLATAAYDRTVAGVISGAGGIEPGVLMYKDGANEATHPVALSGRVYVYADATNGPIELGDLLTTADVSGHAMKVTDYDRAQGAILGKAMSRLEEGTGLVLILVTLQ